MYGCPLVSRLRPPPGVVDGTPTGLYAAGWREVWSVNSDGDAVLTWEPIMPRISDDIADCAIFLYPSEMDAKEGARYGGSGFLVGVPYGASNPTEAVNLFRSIQDRSRAHIYAVTNSHVVDRGAPVVRLNTKEGKSKPVVLSEDKWLRYPAIDDLAVASMTELDSEIYQFRSISTDLFITKDRLDNFGIGIGDDTLMVGRFLNRQERQSNTPVARFGNIAAPAPEFIDQGNDRNHHQQESFLVESHSVSGFSGSPVFVDVPEERRTSGSLPEAARSGKSVTLTLKRSSESSYFLLGVDWGHIDEEKPAGMAGVVPAWRLLDLLFDDRLVNMRRTKEEQEAKRGGATLDSASAPAKKKTRDVEIPPIGRKQFFDGLTKATKREKE